MTKITIKLFKSIISGTGGIQTVIARRLKVEDSSVRKFLDRNPKMRELQDQEREKEVDNAEQEIFSQLRLGTTKETSHLKYNKDFVKIRGDAAYKILKNLGKKRGWFEKQELEIEGQINTLSLTKEECEEEVKRLLDK